MITILSSGETDGRQRLSSSIEISIFLELKVIRQIRSWAIYPSALELGFSVGILESSEISSTNVSGEGPFSPPDLHGELIKFLSSLLESIAIKFDSLIVRISSIPSKIAVSVDGNLVYVILIEEIMPGVPIALKSFLEDEVSLRSIALHKLSSLSVEVF